MKKFAIVFFFFFACYFGISAQNNALISYVQIKNNWINVFDNNGTSIICTGSEATIEYNVFRSCRHQHIDLRSSYYNDWHTPSIHYNNFLATNGNYVTVRSVAINTDVNAQNNYWMLDDIDSLIIDKMDFSYMGGYILYEPKLHQENSNAGPL